MQNLAYLPQDCHRRGHFSSTLLPLFRLDTHHSMRSLTIISFLPFPIHSTSNPCTSSFIDIILHLLVPPLDPDFISFPIWFLPYLITSISISWCTSPDLIWSPRPLQCPYLTLSDPIWSDLQRLGPSKLEAAEKVYKISSITKYTCWGLNGVVHTYILIYVVIMIGIVWVGIYTNF